MNTQSVVEQQKSTQYAAGTGGGAGSGSPGTLPVPERPGDAVQRLKSERVQEELRAMAGWAAAQGETAIECVKTFATPQIAGLYAGFVAQAAAATAHPVTVSLSGGQVCVTVYTPNIDGCPSEVTLPVLAFARQL
jgi:pterin-4a-carbinolamine dehydratase